MKKIVVLGLGVVIAAAIAIGVFHRARAQALDPPNKMSHVDAVELELTIAKLSRLEEMANPLMVKQRDILSRNRISAEEFARGLVRINFETGEIIRQAAKAQP